jgi:hypothetical protein
MRQIGREDGFHLRTRQGGLAASSRTGGSMRGCRSGHSALQSVMEVQPSGVVTVGYYVTWGGVRAIWIVEIGHGNLQKKSLIQKQ